MCSSDLFVLKGKEVIGIIHPHAERGTYGIVEMVWAFTLEGKIKDYIIQRSRERNTKLLKSEKIRIQFKGKGVETPFTFYGTKKINTDLFSLIEGAETAASIVAYSAKKSLMLYRLFFPEYIQKSKENDIEE